MTRVQIFKRVCPPGFDKPLDLGDVVELDDVIAERYIKAEYALVTNDPVTAHATVAPEVATGKVRTKIALSLTQVEALNSVAGRANARELLIDGETYPPGALTVKGYDSGVLVLAPAAPGTARVDFEFLNPAPAPAPAVTAVAANSEEDE